MNTFLSRFTGKDKIISGCNEVLATSNEFISGQSLVWSDSGATNLNSSFGTGALLEIASASANDTSDGTGARTLTVIGAKGTTGEVIAETVTLNGQTSVNTTNKFQLVYAAYVATTGTGLKNAGIIGISIADSTNTSGALTAPTPALTIPVGDNYASGAVFMCPPSSGKQRLRLKKVVYGVSTQPVVITVWLRETTTGAWYKAKTIPLGNVMGNEINFKHEEIILDAGDCIRFDALSTTAAGRVFVEAVLETVYAGPQA